jgi:hypothetical protein
MSGNEFKKPISLTQPLVSRTATQNENQQRAQGLPCHVVNVVSSGIVTIAFDVVNAPYTFPQVTVPVQTSQYERIPIQVGDKGWAVPADAYLGGASGLGGGTADLTRRGNLTTLAFQPLGNTSWPVVDLNAYVLNGPNGVTLQDTGAINKLVLTPTGVALILTAGGVTITVPNGQTLTINGNLVVNGMITVTGDVIIGPSAISFLGHYHEVPDGASGPPI